jgi:hypothetical protein
MAKNESELAKLRKGTVLPWLVFVVPDIQN